MPPNSTVAEVVQGILGYEEFTEAICDALCIAVPPIAVTDAGELEAIRQAEFMALARRVAVEIDAHPRKAALMALLRDDDEVPDPVAIELFNFIYFSMVNRFKGELAELMARPLLRDFCRMLRETNLGPADLSMLPGHEILSRRYRGRKIQQGWYKSADALITATSDAVAEWAGTSQQASHYRGGFGVVAVAEIKAYRANPSKVRKQMRNHIRRLALGCRVGDDEIDVGRAVFAICKSNNTRAFVPFGKRTPNKGLALLMIRPSLPSGPSVKLESDGYMSWRSELPCTAEELSEAAYRFTDWFLGKIGTELYRNSDEPDDGTRLLNPWPSMDLEQAARNRLREAMYSLGNRPFFLGTSKLTRREERARRTFNFLANAMFYGFDNKDGENLLRPEELPGRDEIERSKPLAYVNSAYASGKLDVTERAIKAVARERLDSHEKRRLAWVEAMVAYRNRHYFDALACFPEPDPKGSLLWYHRDTHMLARLHARTGNGAQARTVIAAAASCEGALSVERCAIKALSFIADGDLLRAMHEADIAAESLGKMIKEVRDRERNGLGVPSRLNQNVLQSALLDISAVLSATDRCEKALELLSQLRGTDEWVPEYVAKETLFAQLHSDPNLRSRIEEWKAAEKAHWVSRDSKAGS